MQGLSKPTDGAISLLTQLTLHLGRLIAQFYYFLCIGLSIYTFRAGSRTLLLLGLVEPELNLKEMNMAGPEDESNPFFI